ncbi:efflux RND transporter periplasmic adaptor subunit [Phragmitibacter flavus]|uniref:Efflux RND transporter periplasmic adaptor subunit n=1 Tax=Phragmitibacter flavus TaxID=2576071 RepID=A0A5R8KB86_9BACT|nr:efflux RND transporter periplasmic adaptor subunit [Phragmitibacter flavus]TLD69570.1 efflux RND transporter periplasmic adaptor subunit [Phragmitibacter flavus]
MSSAKPSLDALRIDRSAPPQRRRSPWTLPLTLVILLVIAGGAWMLFGPKPPEVQTTIALEQTTTGPNASPTQTTLLNASGYITARRASTVSSKVTGKVTEVLIEEGMKVEKDQILAHIDATNVTASLRLAEAQLYSAQQAIEEIKPNLTFAEKELTRFTELVATKAASTSDLNRAEAETSSLRARLNKLNADIAVAEREVDSWKQQVEDTIIRAPFTGIVTVKNAQPGEMISPMSSGGFTRTGICTIVDMDSLEIDVDVNESYINRVRANQPVEAILDSYADWKIPSKVIAIIPTADRQKATVKVRVAIEVRDPRILPDMGVKVAFKSAPQKQDETATKPSGPRLTLIPQAALRSIDNLDIVWIIDNDRAQKREVTVAQTNGDQTLLSSGIAPGETIIIDAPSDLKEGTKVTEKKS